MTSGITNKEAIEYNKNLREYMKITDKDSEYKFLKENYEALDVANKALEQQPCEDCISRQYLIERATNWDKHFADSERYVSLTDIQGAPSVTPQPKRGKWIDTGMWLEGRKYGKEHGEMIDAYSCEYCGYSQYHKTNFCPNCGCYCGGDDNGDSECTM